MQKVIYKTRHIWDLYHYLAKKEDDPQEALAEFQSVVDTEEEKGDW